jgi:pimeloyl-ACP methyl ester carboxylesterase
MVAWLLGAGTSCATAVVRTGTLAVAKGDRVRHSYGDARPSHRPRQDTAVILADGRRLQVAEWGASDGKPVVFFHGSPGSRLLCPDVVATEHAGVRYVAFDRPGYGRSDLSPTRSTVADLVPDVEALLDHLEVDTAAMVGWSGGGPVALACAALVPDRVSAVTAVCSFGEPETERDVPPEVFEIVESVRRDPVAAREAVRSQCRWLRDDPHMLLRLTERFSPATLKAPGMRDAFVAWMEEAAAITIEGYVDDWIANCRPWGFELTDVDVPAFSWYGEQDVLVGRHHGELLAAQIPNCESFGCPDCRHFVPIAHWPQILEQVT